MTQDNGMVPLSPPSLGERLDLRGRRLHTRLLMPLPWAGSLRFLLDRVTRLGGYVGRFDRIDATPRHAQPVPARGWAALPGPGPRLPSGPRWPSWAGGVPPPGQAGAGEGRRPHPADGIDDVAAPVDSPSVPLPAAARSRLREVAGDGADAMRIHDDGPADGFARAHRADAVTVGRDVYFRHGSYRPGEESGLALLAHEAVHVRALLQPGAAWRRATGAAVRDEESAARAVERSVLSAEFPPASGERFAPVAGADPVPATPVRGASAVPEGERATHPTGRERPVPDTAAARPLAAPTGRGTTAGSRPAPAELDVQALRRDLVSDVMRRLRTEFERGG
ncbi:DUF4157 domain-containing protein [Streptomyces sp. NPDC053367]|uniref:eCIS core domain-containing protein n=1 Tax=Streptomyces sp. NPDC053367 TaxID=3365700 RepID=UPI0037CF33F5